MSGVILALSAALTFVVLFAPLPLGAVQPSEHHLKVEARSFAFEPAVIRVKRGDRVSLELESVDVTHGIYIDSYGIEATAEPGRKASIEFVADQVGKFRYRCSVACGALHPFMIGELIVEPNGMFPRAVALALVAALGSVAYLWARGKAPTNPDPRTTGRRIELTRIPFLKRLLRWRGFQPTLMLVTLFGFVLVIMTGLLGTPVGSKNFAIIFVWIVWWALLIIVLLPFAGRLWCAVCPIPAPGEWLQRRGIVIKRGGGLLSLARKWPRKLDNIWLQNFAFLGVAIFSGVILTRPWATGAVLPAFILLALCLSLVYERRVFCRYFCPLGGFIGLYSMVSPLELRVKDPEVCRNHREKVCYWGSGEGHGCPWMVRPWRLRRNAYCGLCTECLKTCPKDNIALNLRPFGADLLVIKGRGLDEAYKALIMLACALLYSAVFLGPWGWLKDWADVASISGRALYAAAFLAVNLLVVPGLFLLPVALSKGLGSGRKVSLKRLFVDYSYALVPMGLSVWMAFSFSFVFVNGSYAISVISDPFGWGWNLFGTKGYPWTPVLVGVVPYLQVAALITGLLFSIHTAYLIGRQHSTDGAGTIGTLVPIAGFLAAVTIAFFKLYLG